MTGKPTKAKQDKAATTADETAKKEGDNTRGKIVEATLKTRHCIGGRCKEAGETMRMTRLDYERLKKYDRVE